MTSPSKRRVPVLLGSGKSKALTRGGDKKVSLNLTSMIDMFTILLVFLLKSYSADGQLVTVSDQLTLPKARIEKKVELKLEIQVNNSVIVVDVRSGRDWKSSEFKIKGAHRVDKDIVKWAAEYPKDTTMALYCA